ncbi:hypothetical protein FB451DRAFT_1182989 [Mycena latifolia]|nr:hypothetical protein FB451DRAFT_1182989 [Mycena latifolia]
MFSLDLAAGCLAWLSAFLPSPATASAPPRWLLCTTKYSLASINKMHGCYIESKVDLTIPRELASPSDIWAYSKANHPLTTVPDHGPMSGKSWTNESGSHPLVTPWAAELRSPSRRVDDAGVGVPTREATGKSYDGGGVLIREATGKSCDHGGRLDFEPK